MEGNLFRAGFYYAIKDCSLLSFPSLATFYLYVPYYSPYVSTSIFLDLFVPSTHVPLSESSLVRTINICLSVDLCALHSNVLSLCVSDKLTNASSASSCQALKAE